MAKLKISSTECVHAGGGACETGSSVTIPIVHSAPFSFGSTKELLDFLKGDSNRQQPEYGRMGNPTVSHVETKLAALEGAEKAQLFASGMTAITSLFFTLLRSGDHIIMTSDSYRRTRDFGSFLKKFGISMSVVPSSLQDIEQAIQAASRLVFTEIPTNPHLHLIDIQELVKIASSRGILTVVDSTLATPLNLRPCEFGVDFVVHSATKYLGGHNDLIAGVLAGRADVVQPVTDLLMTLGGICDPNTAFLLDRGLKTLAVRIAQQNENGQAVANFLEAHPKITKVFYPGLESHPHHALAKTLMSGFGGVVTFLVDGGFEDTARFIDQLKIPCLAPSLGGVESLVEQVAVMSYWDMSPEQRRELEIPDNLVRLAVGIERIEDLIADLKQALRPLT